MARRRKIWMHSPPRKAKPRIPDALKSELTQKANELVDSKLKPWILEVDEHAKAHGFNYAVDVYIK